jgi:hypothetical protein
MSQCTTIVTRTCGEASAGGEGGSDDGGGGAGDGGGRGGVGDIADGDSDDESTSSKLATGGG